MQDNDLFLRHRRYCVYLVSRLITSDLIDSNNHFPYFYVLYLFHRTSLNAVLLNISLSYVRPTFYCNRIFDFKTFPNQSY